MVVVAGGCSAHVRGVLEEGPVGVVVRAMAGKPVPLVLAGAAKPLAQLNGYTVEVWGQRALGAIRVERWSVVEGSLPAVVGTLERRGVQLGLLDQGSRAFYFVVGAPDLNDHVGQIVLVEGFVDGPHQIVVVSWRSLTAAP